MNVLRNRFTISMMAMCLLAPAVASAEDANSLREGCRLTPSNATTLRIGTSTSKAGSGTDLRAYTAESVWRQRFWLRVYADHSSGLGKVVKLVQMSNGLCYRRSLGDAAQVVELGSCGDSKAEWIAESRGGGLYNITSTTNTDYVWEMGGTASGSLVNLRLWTNSTAQKFDFGSCRNMNNVAASPG